MISGVLLKKKEGQEQRDGEEVFNERGFYKSDVGQYFGRFSMGWVGKFSKSKVTICPFFQNFLVFLFLVAGSM